MKKTKEEKIKLIEEVLIYNYDGFYVGGIALAHICSILNVSYPPKDLYRTIEHAFADQILEVYNYLTSYIRHMGKNPIQECPHCGQMMKVPAANKEKPQ